MTPNPFYDPTTVNNTLSNVRGAPLSKKATSVECLTFAHIVDVIARNIETFLQLFSVHIPEYNTKMKTTKCANTAAMLMFFLMGHSNYSNIGYCNASQIRQRGQDKGDQRIRVMTELKEKVLDTHATPQHTLYYILMANTDLTCPPESKKPENTRFFPGHVFLVEKYVSASGKRVYYNYYQSYINKYTLETHKQLNSLGNTTTAKRSRKPKPTFSISKKTLEYYLDEMIQLVENPTWNERTSRFWKDMTFVDSSDFNTCSTEPILPCYMEIPVGNMKTACSEFITNALATLKRDLQTGQNLERYTQIEIDEDDKHRGHIRTPEELRIALEGISQELSSYCVE